MLKLMAMGGAAVISLAQISTPANAVGPVSPSSKITVDVVTVNGSGCPHGSAVVTKGSDSTTFTVTYSDYLAQVGVGSTPTDFRKNCQLSLRVHAPQGFTYAVAQADYQGFAHLEDGATGEQKASYYFQGESQTAPVSHVLRGPFEGDWKNTDTTNVAALVYMPCGEDRGLNVNTELKVNAGTSSPEKTTSFMTMDSTHGSVNTVFHLRWKQCP
ncbi:hypothetical protein GCM10017673_41620 [Streptosporangium violaceochromogenes]|nr:hypothetical protein GCM10017673_41620 [Streptosporangium violaceochromogenes]